MYFFTSSEDFLRMKRGIKESLSIRVTCLFNFMVLNRSQQSQGLCRVRFFTFQGSR